MRPFSFHSSSRIIARLHSAGVCRDIRDRDLRLSLEDTMFAELADSTWANRSHRGWTAFASFSVQALAVSILFLLPIIYTEGLPSPLTMRIVLPVPPPAPPAPPPQTHQTIPVTSNMSSRGEVIEPPAVPRGVSPIDEQVAPPPVDLAGFEVAGGTGDSRAQNPVLNSLGRWPGPYCAASTVN